ncbi:MAG TPA: hypothetical protein VH437_08745 [Terriglobales bacterium]|jgi:hypothetical protein
MTYLYAAYFATWAIHIGYAIYLVGQYSRLRDEMKALQSRK